MVAGIFKKKGSWLFLLLLAAYIVGQGVLSAGLRKLNDVEPVTESVAMQGIRKLRIIDDTTAFASAERTPDVALSLVQGGQAGSIGYDRSMFKVIAQAQGDTLELRIEPASPEKRRGYKDKITLELPSFLQGIALSNRRTEISAKGAGLLPELEVQLLGCTTSATLNHIEAGKLRVDADCKMSKAAKARESGAIIMLGKIRAEYLEIRATDAQVTIGRGMQLGTLVLRLSEPAWLEGPVEVLRRAQYLQD